MDVVFEFVKVAGEVGAFGWSGVGECAYAGSIETSVRAGEEERGPEAELGDAVTMGFGDSLDHAVQAESSQVISHSTLGNRGRRLPSEHSKLLAEVSIGKTAGQKTKPDQDVPQCQHA